MCSVLMLTDLPAHHSFFPLGLETRVAYTNRALRVRSVAVFEIFRRRLCNMTMLIIYVIRYRNIFCSAIIFNKIAGTWHCSYSGLDSCFVSGRFYSVT